MADPARAARLAQRIKVVVAEALRKSVKDERAEAITITDARVTSDLQHATVYYTVLGDSAAQQGAREVLDAKRGVLRREVGRNLTIRLTPTLEFVADEVPVNASHVEDLLRQARAHDAEIARLAEGARPAGDADPYRKAESEDGGSRDEDEHESEFDGVEIDVDAE